MPVQEAGTRLARPLPYEFHISDVVTQVGGISVSMNNTGDAGAFFVVYDRVSFGSPRKYTIESQKALSDVWLPAGGGNYSLWLHGANGFVRVMNGTGGAAAISATISYGKVCAV